MSKVDWSKAPDGAEFYSLGNFYFQDVENNLHLWSNKDKEWVRSMINLEDIKSGPTYEERPKQEKPSVELLESVSEEEKIKQLNDELWGVKYESEAKIAELEKKVEFYKGLVDRLTSYEG